jgi:hypothetical protein
MWEVWSDRGDPAIAILEEENANLAGPPLATSYIGSESTTGGEKFWVNRKNEDLLQCSAPCLVSSV